MGFITDTIRSNSKATTPTFPGLERGTDLWNRVFGNVSTNRQEAYKQPPVRGGSYGRSTVAEPAAYKRLLQAMRSMAPGGWSDDRWEQSKHYTDIRYTCIHRTSEQLMQSEFQLFKKDDDHPDGKRPVTKNDPPEGGRFVSPYDAVKLLEKPNNDDTFGDLMSGWNLQMDLTGKALTWMVPGRVSQPHPDKRFDGSGAPAELYVIPTATAIPQPAINPDYPDGYYRIQPLYPYGPFSSYPTPSTAVGAPIPAQWMLQFKYIHPLLRYDGYSPQTGLRLHLDEIEQMDKSRWYTMKRLISPSAVLNFDEMEGMQPFTESEIERIKAEWENEFQGTENVGKLVVGAPGMKLEMLTNILRDMEYKDGWDQLVSFAMAGLGISKEAAGMVGSTAYAVLYAAIKQFHLLTLMPKCARIAAKLTRHLLPFFGDDLILEIKPPKIDDHDIAFGKVGQLIGAKCGTKNEVRKLLDMPITKQPWGEEIAGFEKPPEQPGMEGQVHDMPGAPMQPPAQPMQQPAQQPQEIQQAQPTPGNLGTGSLGPKMKFVSRIKTKSLKIAKKKSVYDQVRAGILANGVHH